MTILSGNKLKLIFIVLPVMFFVSGCGLHSNGVMHGYKKGSGEMSPNKACVENKENVQNTVPAVIYEEMAQCVQKRNYEQSVFLYGLAGSYTWFDAGRVKSHYARSMHIRLLSSSMAKIPETQRDELWMYIQATMNDSTKRNRLCNKVKSAGMPLYHPDYMLLDKSSEQFYSASDENGWNAAVNNYLDCN